MKLTRRTRFVSHRGEEIHEGDAFIFGKDEWIHLSSRFNSNPTKFNDIIGYAIYDSKRKEWWIRSTSNPDKDTPLINAKGVVPSH